jgi:hypothetical protein
MNSGNEQKEIMKEIARIEAEGQGFWLINLFGEKNSLRAVFNPLICWTAASTWSAKGRQFDRHLIPQFISVEVNTLTMKGLYEDGIVIDKLEQKRAWNAKIVSCAYCNHP